MCGRYATTRSKADLLKEFNVDGQWADPELPASFNVAPTQTSAVVLQRPPRDDKTAEPVRQLRNLRWGLVPSWSREPKIGSRMINARAETLAEKPAFRSAYRSRRCLIGMSGFFEWLPTEQLGRSGKPLKQPFYLHPRDDSILPAAGLYEFWRNPDATDDADDAWLTTFTIITTAATDDVGHIHDRMPMTVTPDHWDRWLDPTLQDTAAIAALIAPSAPGSLEIHAVSKAVNNVRSNSPDLIEAIPEETQQSQQ